MRPLPSAGLVLLGLFATSPAWAEPEPTESEPATSTDSSDDAALAESQAGMGTEKVDTEPGERRPGEDSEGAEKGAAPSYGHGGQFGLRVGLSYGYKILIRYEDSPPCDIDGDGADEKVCAYTTPVALDLGLSFALLDGLEPYLWLRLGLSDHAQSFTSANRWFGGGIRIYTMSDSQLKLFFEPALALELEGSSPSAPPTANYATDFVGHVHFGLQYDFLAHVGLYASVGPNVNFVRAIGTELEGSIGLQVRAP